MADKGARAALYMAVTKTLTRAFTKSETHSARIVDKVNDELFRADKKGIFASLFLGVLDLRTGALTYTNAGHNPPYLLPAYGPAEALSERHGPVVGARSGGTHAQGTILLLPEDLILLYTNGVTEAKAPDGQLLGEAELRRALQQPGPRTAKDRARAVDDDKPEGARTDDATLLSLCFDEVATPYWEARFCATPRLLAQRPRRVEAAFADKSATVIARMQLVIDELCFNLLRHGLATEGAPIEVTGPLEGLAGEILLALTAPAQPFDPAHAPLQERPLGELGLLLFQRISDGMRPARNETGNLYRFRLCVENPQLHVIQKARAS